MAIKVGDKIPSVTLKHMQESGAKEVSTDELFKGKKVLLFAVPGAFTPACSNQHLPGYIQNAEQIKAKGIDTIACISVNDVFVMDAWGKSQNAGEKVLMLADGDGEFAKAAGLELDLNGKGLGMRSQRYAMVVEDGTVKELELEDGGKLENSTAEKLLAKL
ncbi:MAG: peroxiredoxin [Rivularia sp. (in: Bacteria)]|nr:peroxiredoxin [Rivularia sp. MS3]